MKPSKKPDLKSKVRQLLGLSFKNKDLLESALIHPSARQDEAHAHLRDFDRLEFFGDAILNFVICKKIYELYPDSDEGKLSRIRSVLVSRKLMAKVARDLKVHHVVVFGKALKKQPLALKTKTLADIFEAIIGALMLDAGIQKTENFILSSFKPYFDTRKLFRIDSNPKSTLQELTQKHWKLLPQYTVKETPKGHQVTVKSGRKQATAIARTRQTAEIEAAKILIQKLRHSLSGTSGTSRSKRGSSSK